MFPKKMSSQIKVNNSKNIQLFVVVEEQTIYDIPNKVQSLSSL